MKTILRITAILALLAGVCSAQMIIQVQNAGTPVVTAKKWLVLNCVSGLNCAYSNGVLGITVTGGAGAATFSANGAASTPSVSFTGTPFTGGDGTTTVPLFYLNSGASAPSAWNTNGTLIGANLPSGYLGNLLDFHVNGAGSSFSVSTGGTVTTGGGGTYLFSGRTRILSPSDGVLQITNQASNGFTRLQLGLTTSSGPAFGVSGTTITAQLGDGTAGGILAASQHNTIDGSFGSSVNQLAAACETAFATTTLATGATTTDTGLNCLPANSIIDAVVARVTTTITAACTGWSLGDATTGSRFASNNTTLTSGTTTDAAHIGTFNNTGIASATTGIWQAAAAKVRITCAGGNPGAGAVRVIVYYHTWTAPTS